LLVDEKEKNKSLTTSPTSPKKGNDNSNRKRNYEDNKAYSERGRLKDPKWQEEG